MAASLPHHSLFPLSFLFLLLFSFHPPLTKMMVSLHSSLPVEARNGRQPRGPLEKNIQPVNINISGIWSLPHRQWFFFNESILLESRHHSLACWYICFCHVFCSYKRSTSIVLEKKGRDSCDLTFNLNGAIFELITIICLFSILFSALTGYTWHSPNAIAVGHRHCIKSTTPKYDQKIDVSFSH